MINTDRGGGRQNGIKMRQTSHFANRGRSARARGERRPAAMFVTLLCAVAPAPAFAATFDCVMEPSLTVKLGSPIASIISKIEVERGDRVTEGQVVARIESSVEAAVVAANKARVESTAELSAKQALLEQKSGILSRKSGLQQLRVTSNQDLENAQAEFNVAQQEVALARLNHHMAEIELERSVALLEQRTIRSPIDGIVTARTLGPGEYVHQDSTIATIARISPLNVETFLPVRYFGLVKVGDVANVRPDDPVGGDRPAEVNVVDQVFDAASGTFGVRLKLANPDNSVPGGLRCRITFDFPEQPSRSSELIRR